MNKFVAHYAQEIFIPTPLLDHELRCNSKGNGSMGWVQRLLALLAALGSVSNPFLKAIWPDKKRAVIRNFPQSAYQVAFDHVDPGRAH
jgi:hypothetical protein